MIPTPGQPIPAGKGKIAEQIRNLRRAAMSARVVGRGVSTGPLGTTVRPTRRITQSSGGGAVWG